MGGDGCPFGKNESACSFLLSFINVGKRVASSNDKFVIFGANCEETLLVREREKRSSQSAELRNYLQRIN